MKKKYLSAFLIALLSISAADATVYLLKDGKVVASYDDEAVDAITFDDPTEYEVSTESVMMHQIYYGDALTGSNYNFAMLISDTDYDDKGQLPLTSTSFMLRLQTPEPADLNAPLIPAGRYSMKPDADAIGTIAGDQLTYIRQITMTYFVDATLDISYDESTATVNATLVGTDADGKSYRTVYSGGPIWMQDFSIKWYEEDFNLTGGTLTATYLRHDTGFDNKCNINIMIAEHGYTPEGWMVTPGSLITLVGNAKIDSEGKFVPGTWEIMEGEVAEENKLLAGRSINFMGAPFPVNTTIKHYVDKNTAEVGLITSGKVNVSELSPGMYRLTYDFETHTGHKVTGTYVGRIEINNFTPEEENYHLTADYELDLSKSRVECADFGDEWQLKAYTFSPNYSYLNDYVELRIVPKNNAKLGPGVYKVKPDGESAGRIKTGTYTPKYSTGSVFKNFASDGSSDELLGSGITDGHVEITENSDGTWTITYDLVDDTEERHKITGSWTGTPDNK